MPRNWKVRDGEGKLALDRYFGKLESLLSIADQVRAMDSRMEIQMLVCLLYVARHEDEYGSAGMPMSKIAEALGLAQSSTSRNVTKLSEALLNPPGEVLERAAKKRRPPSREALKPKFGMGLLYTMDNPADRREKMVFLSPKGQRFVNRLSEYAIESETVSEEVRLSRLKRLRAAMDERPRDVEKMQYKYRLAEMESRNMLSNLQQLHELQEKFQMELAKIKEELTYRMKQDKVQEDMINKLNLKKKNLLSSGYMREGANVRTSKKK